MSASPEVVAAARDLYAMGYVLVALAGKKPITEGWRERPFTLEEVEAQLQRPDASGIGFPCGPLNHDIVSLDFDSLEIEAWWQDECRKAGIEANDFPTVWTPGKILKDGTRRAPGCHRYVTDIRGSLGNSRGKLKGLDPRGKGQTVLPPSPHPDGGKYRWIDRHCFADYADGIPSCPDFLYREVERPKRERKSTGYAGPRTGTRPDERAYKYCRAALERARRSAPPAPASAIKP